MKLCRYIITPVSPWSGELRSDTLYGLICWYVAESEGAAACSELIEGFSAGRPPFKLSSAMPADFLPMPSLPPISRKRFRELVEKSGKDEHGLRLFSELQKFKKFRKKSWLPLSTWQQHKGRLSTEALFLSQREDRREEEKTSPIAFEPHVSINRNTGSAQEGQLFFMRLRYFTQGTKLHLYAQAEDPAYLLKYLRLIGELGFGKDAGTGHGQFDVMLDASFQPDTLALADANSHLLLSVCAAPDMRNISGYYKLETKRGKTGPGFANPFKKPFLMLQEGSVLDAPFSGPFVLKNISADSRVVQILEPLVLPCIINTREGEQS